MTATAEFYTLSLHDALPISVLRAAARTSPVMTPRQRKASVRVTRSSALNPFRQDRKSTRLNSSYVKISYAVFCLKKKRKRRHSLLLRIHRRSFVGVL